MNITFRQGSGELSDALVQRAQVKLLKLSRFIDETEYEAFVHVDVERESASQNSPSLWRTTMQLSLAGDVFTATSTGETPDKATELAIKELKREVRKAKGRQRSLARRGHELLKRLRHSAPSA